MKSTSVQERLARQPQWLKFFGWYLFWFVVILCIFKPGLLMFPKKDHFFFMLGRQLFDNDITWFLQTLSYNRTRLLYPGDYFAFRPVLMAILGLEDIFLRHNLLALGIIGCGLFSFTTTVLFTIIRRLAGLFPALALAIIWCANLAGSELLLWQHITPYVLAPGFLFSAFSCLASLRSPYDGKFSLQVWPLLPA
jgi:hypothetical protein